MFVILCNVFCKCGLYKYTRNKENKEMKREIKKACPWVYLCLTKDSVFTTGP